MMAAMDAICSTTVPVGTPLHWSTDSRAISDGWDKIESVAEGRESVAGKPKYTGQKLLTTHTHMHASA